MDVVEEKKEAADGSRKRKDGAVILHVDVFNVISSL